MSAASSSRVRPGNGGARTRRRSWRRGVLVGAAAALGMPLIVAAGVAAAVLGWRYPVERLRPSSAASLVIEDRHGQVLHEIARADGGKARWVSLPEMPPALVAATLTGEDRRFFEHEGVDPIGVLRALWLDARRGHLAYGGSTLTMQLVRMVEPHPRSIWGKLEDVVQALRLERALPKREILEQYLNRAYYANGAFGVEAAAELYFGKPARALSDGEAVLLATIPRAPGRYDPWRHLDAAVDRRRHLLDELVASGALEPAARARIEATPLALAPPRRVESTAGVFHAPHFVDYVLQQLPPVLREQGGVVHTTLDLPLQQRVEALVRARAAALRQDRVQQAGAVVLDARTGEVLAMVGSVDYFAAVHHGQMNAMTFPTSPGSALKPFTYALAIEQGDSPASIAWDVVDVPSSYRSGNGAQRQHGPVRYRTALACSYNLAAAHVAERVGIPRLLDRLRDAGLATLTGSADDYGAALTLGAGDVRPLDLAAAYGFLVNGGWIRSPRAVKRVDPVAGGEAWSPPLAAPHRLFSRGVSWLVMDMLSDPEARRPAFGDDLPLDLPFRVAAKTGTAPGMSNAVTVLATSEYLVAAWVGNFDGQPMHDVLAMWSAAPLAREVLLAAADGRALTLPERPPEVVERSICALSGESPGPACPARHEYFLAGTAPAATCSWHRRSRDRVWIAWPPQVAHWAALRQKAGGQSPAPLVASRAR